MRRTWIVVSGLGILTCAGLAWLFTMQPARDQLGLLTGVLLIVVGLFILVLMIGPLATMLDRVGLGRPRTRGERLRSVGVGFASMGSVGLLLVVAGPRPGFLLTFIWLWVTLIGLTAL